MSSPLCVCGHVNRMRDAGAAAGAGAARLGGALDAHGVLDDVHDDPRRVYEALSEAAVASMGASGLGTSGGPDSQGGGGGSGGGDGAAGLVDGRREEGEGMAHSEPGAEGSGPRGTLAPGDPDPG